MQPEFHVHFGLQGPLHPKIRDKCFINELQIIGTLRMDDIG